MTLTHATAPRPTVQLVGDIDHPEFRDAVDLLRGDADVVDAQAAASPELILVAKSRPDAMAWTQVTALRRRAPLAGAVALLGSWCEGESRTGRPWPGVPRLYWYEFPSWWRRQMMLRTAGRCPDWARPESSGRAGWPCHIRRAPASFGLVVVRTAVRDTAESLAELLRSTGYASIWSRSGGSDSHVYGAVAGIWDGGQLDDYEAADLHSFCRELSRDAAPVIALLDFPRRDRAQLALEWGAAAVVAKPWDNDALIETVHDLSQCASDQRAA